jgi:purine-nucleoside phosphorylase
MSATAAAYLKSRIDFTPRVLVILGSGLGVLADQVEDAITIPFDEVPGLAASSVEGHKGRFIAGRLDRTEVLFMQGRLHLYEGHTAETVAAPVRAAAELGVETMIVSNAAGGVNRGFRPGDLMLIDDHINLMWQNPLTGRVREGESRFPDMSAPYDRGLQELAGQIALEQGLLLVRGTYLAVTGPSYETPAEIKMYERMGADAVGMSTVPEVIAARANGMRVLGFSLITNLASGYSNQPLSHAEVIEAGANASAAFGLLIRGIIAAL